MSLLDRARRSIERPIQQKFKSAISPIVGDGGLFSALGKILSQPALAERVYGEAEVFLIKGGLFLSGVRLDPSAYDGIGSVWKEDVGQRHYDPDARVHHERPLPHALQLPHGFYIPVFLDPKSPFMLRREGSRLYLYLEDFRLFPVEFERRPSYYSRTTNSGVPMHHIGPQRLQRQVLIEFNAYCHYFSLKKACLFCGITADKPILRNRHNKAFAAAPAEVAEVVEAAFADGSCTEMQITGGVLPERAEVDYILEVGHTVRDRLGVSTMPMSQANLVPPSLQRIDELREAGWEGVAFNLEVWDPNLWQGVVPGKAATVTRQQWLEALEHAAQVFGKGQVASVLVAGLEPKTSYLEGIEWLAERGIYGVPIPWAPAPGSQLEGHQTPTAAWHLDLVVKVVDIWERYGLPSERHSSGGLHYSDIGRMRTHVRREQREHPEKSLEGDLRRMIAFEGRLPEM